ncbi:MAG: tRNA threonylcarbamoyladenosine dehydratase [Polyangiaceae bacterium]|nr:tRNA threonylcarbamoyladenosine dehydratase [Polyangiaceae bacterium]
MDLPLTRDAQSIITRSSASSESNSIQEQEYRLHRRFDRAARLFSEPGLQRLMGARVAIVGVGGVGSFTAESLARSGVGTLRLIDFDKVCVTNTNRQLHAMQGTIGKEKVEIMAERLRLIHPTGRIETVPKFYNEENSDFVLDGDFDYVVDAIDNLRAKAHLILTCLKRKIPLVSSMGAAARMDPTQVRVADLGETYRDPFAAALRKMLRRDFHVDLPKGGRLGVPAVFSIEEPTLPSIPSYDQGVGFRCVCPGGKNGLHDCDRRSRIDGTASFVTGTFGLTAASVVVKDLIQGEFAAADRVSGATLKSERR